VVQEWFKAQLKIVYFDGIRHLWTVKQNTLKSREIMCNNMMLKYSVIILSKVIINLPLIFYLLV
jgi:hypothetical protein